MSGSAASLTLAKDVGISSLAHGDLETWQLLMSRMQEAIAALLRSGESESDSPWNKELSDVTASFFETLLEAIVVRGFLSASDSLVATVTYLTKFSGELGLVDAKEDFVRMTTGVGLWTLKHDRPSELITTVKSIAEETELHDGVPSDAAFDGLKQLADLMTRQSKETPTYVSLIWQPKPWEELMAVLDGCRERADSEQKSDVLFQLMLTYEVVLARAWESRDCEDILIAALGIGDIATAARHGGGFGYMILMPGQMLTQTYVKLRELDSCQSEANQVLQKVVEVAANGYRGDLRSQIGPIPGRQLLSGLVESNRPSLRSCLLELNLRSQYESIPRSARTRLIRELQDSLDDNLGFAKRLRDEEDSNG